MTGWFHRVTGRGGGSAAVGNDRDARLPPRLREVLLSVAKHAIVSAFVLSLVVHLIGLVSSGWIRIWLGGGEANGAIGGGDAVEFAVVGQGQFDQLAGGGIDLSAPAVPELEVKAPTAPDMLGGVAGDAPGLAPGEISDVGGLAGGGDIGGGGMGEGLGGAGGGGASFFGVEARGSRFAFVVDISGSMGVNGKIEAMRTELAASVVALQETAQFFIVPYSTTAAPLGGRPDWTEALSVGKKWAVGQIQMLAPDGGTEPLPAFKAVFALRPRPDAIYFMTDGEFNADVVDELAILNVRARVPIHCICFATRESEEMMRKIATQSRGSFTFVPGPP